MNSREGAAVAIVSNASFQVLKSDSGQSQTGLKGNWAAILKLAVTKYLPRLLNKAQNQLPQMFSAGVNLFSSSLHLHTLPQFSPNQERKRNGHRPQASAGPRPIDQPTGRRHRESAKCQAGWDKGQSNDHRWDIGDYEAGHQQRQQEGGEHRLDLALWDLCATEERCPEGTTSNVSMNPR